MTITLNEQLKKFRKYKGNTQEELASFLGISVQAVSKWERGEGYPDITLLPSLAAFYDVSVDDILGINEQKKQDKLEEYLKRGAELAHNGKSRELVDLWRKARKEIPNNPKVVFNLMMALSCEDRRKYADEIIECGKIVLEKSNDADMISGTARTLCFTYYNVKKDGEEAKKYANMLPRSGISHQMLMARILEGEESVKQFQCNIQDYLNMIHADAAIMVTKGAFSNEEKIKIYTFLKNIYSELYSDGNFGFYHVRMFNIHSTIAHFWMELGNKEEALLNLEAAAKHAITYDTRSSGMYTSFMVDRCFDDVDASGKDYTENESARMLEKLKRDAFAPLRDDIRIKNIVSELEKHAKY